ncbi:MAG: aldo/keto reductase [Candidatus Nanopelagicales bacterium]|nr:aldo/keto reductase [Candidatus Nanopelagicales bacterium]
MRYRKLGTTGIDVSTQCLGTMMYGANGNTDHDDCVSQIHHALESGINFIDTADVYSQGESEVIVGKALAGRRDDVLVATKCFNPMGEGRNRRGSSRRWIIQACEESLGRLGTDYIDLYQVHRLDWDTDIEEIMDALTTLVQQGKVRYLGSSTYPAEWIVEAQWASRRRNAQRFVCEQPQYSIFAREIEPHVLPTAMRHSMGVIPWSPLAGGWLTGKYRRDIGLPKDSRYGGGGVFARMSRLDEQPEVLDARYELVERLDAVAKAADLTLTQMAYGFVDAHPAVTSTIIGPRTRPQLDDALAAADVALDGATLDAIDAICPVGTNAPGVTSSAPNPAFRRGNRRRG